MGTPLTDEELLTSHELGSFALFYRAHVDELLGFFCRRTGDAELAADLTAETFAAALAGRRRFRSEAGSATGVAVRDRLQAAGIRAAPRRGRAPRQAAVGDGADRANRISRFHGIVIAMPSGVVTSRGRRRRSARYCRDQA
jgi:Sigma-70 region 2